VTAPKITLNDQQGLYVIHGASSISCLGYDVCYEESLQMSQKLDRPDLAPDPARKGTFEQYDNYLNLQDILFASKADLGTWFKLGTPPAVREILERYRKSGERLVMEYGDRETGRAWGDVKRGTIGRSMGPMKSPLLIASSRSRGGGVILDDCIVRILDGDTKRELYRHPSYHVAPAQPQVEAEGPEPDAAPGMAP